MGYLDAKMNKYKRFLKEKLTQFILFGQNFDVLKKKYEEVEIKFRNELSHFEKVKYGHTSFTKPSMRETLKLSFFEFAFGNFVLLEIYFFLGAWGDGHKYANAAHGITAAALK